jgi:hypothetical protein
VSTFIQVGGELAGSEAVKFSHADSTGWRWLAAIFHTGVFRRIASQEPATIQIVVISSYGGLDCCLTCRLGEVLMLWDLGCSMMPKQTPLILSLLVPSSWCRILKVLPAIGRPDGAAPKISDAFGPSRGRLCRTRKKHVPPVFACPTVSTPYCVPSYHHVRFVSPDHRTQEPMWVPITRPHLWMPRCECIDWL